MSVSQTQHFRLSLDGREREQLIDLLNEALVDVHAEARRTDAQNYKDRLHEQQAFLTRLSEKLANVPPIDDDLVDFESEQSFPASDPPGWTR